MSKEKCHDPVGNRPSYYRLSFTSPMGGSDGSGGGGNDDDDGNNNSNALNMGNGSRNG